MPDQLAAATLARLRDHMVADNYDWLVLGSPQNVAYATGYRSVAGDIFPAHQMIAMVSQTDVILVAPAADFGAASEHVALDRIEPFGTFYFESADQDPTITTVAGRHESLAEALRSATRRFGVTGRVGVDTGPGEHSVSFTAGIPGIDFESVDLWMQTVRSVKLSAEVERLAAASRLADKSIQAALAVASPGVSERDLATVVATTMTAGGGTPRFVVVTSGDRSALSDARPTSRLWQRGELLRLDVGCTYDGYWSDLGRTAVLGEPNDLQASRYEAIKAGEDAQLHAAAPGVLASTLFATAVESVEDAGLRPYRRHHCGHGIGLNVYEPPIISPGTEIPLQSGMVLCFETPLYEIGWGGMMVEDTVVITADGNRRLNHSDRSLRVVDG